MALGFTTLLSVRSGTDATSYTTASVDIVQDRIYALAINTVSTGSAIVAPTVTGAGQTWTLEEDNVYDDVGAQRRGVHVYRCKGDATESGALTIDYSGITQSGIGYILIEITDADLSGTNGAGAVLQSVSAGNTTATTSRTVTLAALGSADNAALGFFDKQSVAETFTEGSGFTELADVGAANPSSQFMAEWKLNETSVSASWTTSVVNGAIALEIKAAAGASDNVPQGGATAAGVGQSATVPVPQGGAPAAGTTPSPAASVPQGGATAAGQAPTGAQVTVPQGGALAAGQPPAAAVPVAQGGAAVAGQAPTAAVGVPQGGANVAGNPVTVTVPVPQGGAAAGGIGPTAIAALPPGGADAAGIPPTARVPVPQGGALAGGFPPDDGQAAPSIGDATSTITRLATATASHARLAGTTTSRTRLGDATATHEVL